jgi:hypothetical protein
MEVKFGREKRTVPVAFLQPREDGVYHYRYDFDRDGADEWVLENSNLRLIVSPESGGRALALLDNSSGANLSTSVGLFRDNFSFTENPPGGNELRARGRYGLFNRPYSAEWESAEKNAALKLHYDAPDIYPGGASIEKLIQLDGASGVRVDYRVALKERVSESGAVAIQAQSFASVNSFPATSRPGRVTKFCWAATNAAADAAPSTDANRDGGQHCEDFVAAGEPIELPAGTKRMEVHTTGRRTTVLEWDCVAECARMTIEPKNFSALLRLVFPPLTVGGAAAHYTIHVRAIGPD